MDLGSSDVLGGVLIGKKVKMFQVIILKGCQPLAGG